MHVECVNGLTWPFSACSLEQVPTCAGILQILFPRELRAGEQKEANF